MAGAAGLLIIALLVAKFMAGGIPDTDSESAGTASQKTASMEMTRLTSSGQASEAAISPDGNYIAFRESQPQQTLWVSHISTGSKVQVVDPSPTFFIWDPTFAPQSDYVYYCGKEQGAGFPGLYRVPVLGGPSRKVADRVDERISFSPDGQRIVFNRSEPGMSSLVVSNVNGSEQKVIATRHTPQALGDPSWSPDGKTIAAAINTWGLPEENILLVASEGGEERLLFDEGWGSISEVAWLSDGTGLVFEGFDAFRMYAGQIWEVSFPGGIARRITNDLNIYGGLAVDGTGTRVVTTQLDINLDLWVTTPGGSSPPVQLTRTRGTREGLGLDWTPDGRIVYGASIGKEVSIWSMDADGANTHEVSSGDWHDLRPRATPDGRFLVFASNRAQTVNIWRSNADGSNAIQLTHGLLDWAPAVTPDGQWVIYIGGDGRNVLKIPIDGGDPVQLNDRFSQEPASSPDGRLIAAWTWDQEKAQRGLDIIPFEGGEPLQRLEIIGGGDFTWSPDGRSLTIDIFADGADNLFDYPLDGGERRQLTNFSELSILAFAWSPDGEQIVISRRRTERDVVLLQDFR